MPLIVYQTQGLQTIVTTFSALVQLTLPLFDTKTNCCHIQENYQTNMFTNGNSKCTHAHNLTILLCVYMYVFTIGNSKCKVAHN